ncbi:MAG: xylulokinase [Candidatus Izimaplasma sp.]|nr:xylulokinase [Candidatus Izimaplasma bacterium]
MFIGIDLGTSGVKLVLLNKTGEIIKTVTKNYDLIIPQSSWAEQDPNEWFEMSLAGLKELIKGYENKIDSLSFSGQMHGLVILDKNDKVLRNAILWNDQRTFKEVDYLNNEIGIDFLQEQTGNIALTGLTAPKILWVKNNESDIFKKISKIMLPKDYLAYRLTGVFATDVSDVSGTLYFDVKNKRYSAEMLKILGINLQQLPKVYESSDIIGSLTEKIKNHLAIQKNVSVVIGGGDQAVGALGVGVVKSGESSISLGTSGVVFVASDSFKVDNISYFQSYCHSNGQYHLMSVMLNAGGALKWWSEQVFNNYNYDEFFNNISDIDPSNDLFFLPYLSGERAPINDPYAQGVFLGLSLSHRKEHLDRAVIEGITFALKDSLELIRDLGVNISSVRITGGGAKSQVWAQMIADILDVEVYTMKAEEGPAFGAAILAMVGAGVYKNVQNACENLIKINKRFQQNEKNVKIYSEKYLKFGIIYPNVKEIFKI